MTASAPLTVAVIGAGLAGLACASELARRGAQVTVFDKGTTPGGRTCTRSTSFGSFDHGAQYFTAHNVRFDALLEGWVDAGLVARWGGRLLAFDQGATTDKTQSAHRFVGLGGMDALARHLAATLDVQQGRRIVRLERRNGRWFPRVDGDEELTAQGFDAVVLAMPAQQALRLAREHSPIAGPMTSVEWAACWAVMVALPRSARAEFDGAFLNDDPVLSWVARDSGKPERGEVPGVAERWVLHAKPAWSTRFFEQEPAVVARQMLNAFAARLGREVKANYLAPHRWRFATPINPLRRDFLWDSAIKLGAAGDWCNGPRVEGAFLSGLALATAILD